MAAALLVGATLLGGAAASAQTQPVDLSAYPLAAVEDLPERYRDWLEREVRWLVTDAERDVFLRLPTDTQRDRFIEEFWRQRDPSPGTAHNEYLVEHRRRLQYATEILGRGSTRPGWRGDRGRIYILLGEPQSVMPFYNTQLAVPMELWFYATDVELGLPGFFYVLFFKPNGIGEFRIYSPVNDGPASLLNEAGRAVGRGNVNDGRARPGNPTGVGDEGGMLSALDEVDRELANAAVSLIPGSGLTGIAPLRSEMLLAQIDNLPYRIMPSAPWAYRLLTGAAESTVRFETLALQVSAVGLIDAEGSPFLHFAVRTAAAELNLDEHEGEYFVTFEVSRSLTTPEGKALVSDSAVPVEIGLEAESARDLRRSDLTYLDRLPVAPGAQSFGVMIENNVSREYGRAQLQVRVPEVTAGRIGGGTPFLVLEHDDLAGSYDSFDRQLPFQLGRNFVLPALDGPFPSGGTLWVFHQVYAPEVATDEARATYRLVDATGEVLAEKTSRLPLARTDSHGVLNQLSGIPLEGVPPGSYVVEVELDVDDWATARLPARVVAANEYASPFVHARPQPPGSDPEVQLSRARQLRVRDRLGEAIDVARGVLVRERDSAAALDLLIDLLGASGRHTELRELLESRLAADPGDLDMLLRMAEVSARVGEHYDAIRYFERARIGGAPETPALLNSLAAEYLADGRSEAARALLLRSLELDPDQPRMRALLDRTSPAR